MSAKDIFDKAILIKPGQTLLVPCHDFKQQESLRVSLAYHRRAFLDRADVDFDILSSKVTKGGKPFVALVKSPRITTGFIIEADGEVSTTSLMPDTISEIAHDAVDLTRIKKAMREDGFSEAEIEAYINDQKLSKIDTSDEPVCLAPEKEEE